MPISSLLINYILLLAIGFAFRSYLGSKRIFSILCRVFAVAGLIWLVISALAYPLTPLFYDHAEANIAAVAANWRLGGALYTDLQSAARYSLLYGPWPYIVAGVFQSMGGEAFAFTKLTGVVNLVVLLLAFYFLLSSFTRTRMERIYTLGVLSLALLGYYQFSYWNRPDSFMMLYVFLGLILVIKASVVGPGPAFILMGLLAGLASACKFHGFLYFIPIVAYFLETQRVEKIWAKMVGGAVFFFVGLSTPFLLPNIGWIHYFEWLQMASKHGLDLKEILRNLSFISFFLIFFFLLGFHRQHRNTFLVFCCTSIIVAIIAGKPGAGSHHFMPLVPVIIWLAAVEFFKKTNPEQLKKAMIIVAAFVLTISLNAVNRQKQIVKLFSQVFERKAELEDLQRIVSLLDGAAEIGFSDMARYQSTFYKVWMVQQEKGLLFDGAALMDMGASSMNIPASTLSDILTCKIPNFILPNTGAPWSLVSFYGEKPSPIFSEEFKSAFEKAYEIKETTKYYALYRCR